MNRRGTVLRAGIAATVAVAACSEFHTVDAETADASTPSSPAAPDATAATPCERHSYGFDGDALDGWTRLEANGDASVRVAPGWADGGAARASVVNKTDHAYLKLAIPDRRSILSIEMSGTVLVPAGTGWTPIGLFVEDDGQKDDHFEIGHGLDNVTRLGYFHADGTNDFLVAGSNVTFPAGTPTTFRFRIDAVEGAGSVVTLDMNDVRTSTSLPAGNRFDDSDAATQSLSFAAGLIYAAVPTTALLDDLTVEICRK